MKVAYVDLRVRKDCPSFNDALDIHCNPFPVSPYAECPKVKMLCKLLADYEIIHNM